MTETQLLIETLRKELRAAHRIIANAAPTVSAAMQDTYGTDDYDEIGDDEQWLKEFMKFNSRAIP